MTKAIAYFKRKIETENQICDLPTCDDEVKTIKQEHIAYMQSAIAALEKQIPKEVSTMRYRNDYDWTCNNCDTTFEYIRYTTDKPKYCPNCGQALKWE